MPHWLIAVLISALGSMLGTAANYNLCMGTQKGIPQDPGVEMGNCLSSSVLYLSRSRLFDLPASQQERRPCPSHADRQSEHDTYTVGQLRHSNSIKGEAGRSTTHPNSDSDADASPDINADTYPNPRSNSNTRSNPGIAPCSNARALTDDPTGQCDTLRSH